MGTFSKLFVAVMAHIIMEHADKKIKLILICFQLKIVDMLLSFFLLASLYKLFIPYETTFLQYIESLGAMALGWVLHGFHQGRTFI